MSKFIGVKLIDAVVMTAGKAREKGYRVNQNCIDDAAGYEVTYESGYKSWSPADVFEKYYYMLQDNEAKNITLNDCKNFIKDYDDEFIIIEDKVSIGKGHCLNQSIIIGEANVPTFVKNDKEYLEQATVNNIIEKVSEHLNFVLDWAKNGLVIACEKSPVEGGDDEGSAIPPHIQRMIKEREELKDKLTKLDKFINSNPLFTTLPNDEQDDMKHQLTYMYQYLGCLVKRLERVGYN